MSVFRSNKQIYVQLIDDLAGKTLASTSSKGIEGGTKCEIAAKVGQAIASARLRLQVSPRWFLTATVICSTAG